MKQPWDQHEIARPSLGIAAAGPTEAVASFVAELQAGWDNHDADIADRRLGHDVLWGSPFGVSVQGFEELHAIHVRLKKQGMGGPASRFEVERVLALGPDVAVAHVRRAALGADGRPLEPTLDLSSAFSEMTLYVLVRRAGLWWLAAGHNTPIRRGPSAADNRASSSIEHAPVPPG